MAKAYNNDGLLLQMGDSMKPINEIIKSKARPDFGELPVGNIDLLSFFGERFGSQESFNIIQSRMFFERVLLKLTRF